MTGPPKPGYGPPNSALLAQQALAIVGMKYVSLSIDTALMWEILVTFNLEVKHIYQHKMSVIKALWFANRIGVPITLGVHAFNVFSPNPSNKFCQVTGDAALWLSSFNLFVIQANLCLRVLAMSVTTVFSPQNSFLINVTHSYRRAKIITTVIGFLLFASTLTRILIFALKPIRHAASHQSGASGCLELPDGNTIAGAYWAPLILDSTLFIMTLRSVGTCLPDSRNLFSHMPIITVLFRDGAIYFLVVVVSIALTVAGYYSRPLLGPFTSSYLFLGVMSIACSRLVLHLRDAAVPPESPTSMLNVSRRDMEFNVERTAAPPVEDVEQAEPPAQAPEKNENQTSTTVVDRSTDCA